MLTRVSPLLLIGLSCLIAAGCGDDEKKKDNPGVLILIESDASQDLSPDMVEDMGEDETRDLATTLCVRDERVLGNQCQSCAPGSTNDPGDDPSGADTQCDVTLCQVNERVLGNQCQMCPAGSTNAPGDDTTGGNTMCDATLCKVNERVVNKQCQPCPANSINAAGDDASGPNTTCMATICSRNQRVVNKQCQTCPAGTTNEPGDDATGANTTCDDPCTVALGVACDDVEQAYIKSSNAGSGDEFGHAVAISGDTIVVGAHYERSAATGVNGNQTSNSAPSSGAAYVFTRINGRWTQQAYLKASNAEFGDRFGHAVAISGDTIVVSAKLEDGSATGANGAQNRNTIPRSGAVYVFTRTNTTWTQQAYLKASNTGGSDEFGSALALDGDTLAVGARWEDSDAAGVDGDQSNDNAENSGAVYVFTRTNTTWSQQAYLKASNPDADDEFGFSLALSNDTLAVGAREEDSNATGINGDQTNANATDSGAVYVFTRTNATWSQQAYLKASNTGERDAFGTSVAISGETLVVGATSERSNASGVNGDQSNNAFPSSGAVYVFTRTNAMWRQQAYIKASNPDEFESFGSSLAISADTLVVGARGEDSNATGINGNQSNSSNPRSGGIYLFSRTNTTWQQQLYIKAPNTDENDEFGQAIALSGNTLAVGARGESSASTTINGNQANNTAQSSGATYTYQIAP